MDGLLYILEFLITVPLLLWFYDFRKLSRGGQLVALLIKLLLTLPFAFFVVRPIIETLIGAVYMPPVQIRENYGTKAFYFVGHLVDSLIISGLFFLAYYKIQKIYSQKIK